MADKKPATTKTVTTAKSTPAKQPKTAAKPAATKSTAAKPVAKPAAKPTATAKPATTKPTAASKPAVKTAPTAKTKTASVVKPAVNGGGTVVVKPATTAKSTAKPATTPKTAAAATSNATAKPAVSKPATKTTVTKQSKTAKTAKSGGAATLTKKQIKLIVISAAAVLLTLCLILGVFLGIVPAVKNCNSRVNNGYLSNVVIPTPTSGQYNLSTSVKPTAKYENVSAGEESYYNEADKVSYEYDKKYVTNTAVGYYGEVIGTVKRNIPQTTRDEGLGVYPKYGYTLNNVIGSDNSKTAARGALVTESSYLAAWGTAGANRGGEETADKYTWIDENGFLFRGTRAEPVKSLDKSGKQRRLYKHTASTGLYMGDVSDNEPGIIKRVTMRPRGYSSYGVTGVYAPAGEIVKIQLSDADMTATGGLTVHIGQALYNGQANNIWVGKNQMQRMPHLLNTLEVNKNTAVYEEDEDGNGVWTAYVGSFLGGPLYIRHEGVTFTATISGGVAYKHFILGYTSQEEFEETSKSSAPYFDLEVWNYGVLHSGPKTYAKSFSYEQLYNAAVLWDKVASVTTTNGSKQGIVFIYDPFVAAGAAVAFPGRSSVNCPTGWMSGSLNYNSIVSSGSWGNFHEYHHNFQNFGVGYTGEVTNNALTLVSYSLFTKISSARQISSYGVAGLSGWNNYTSATWALNRVNTEQISSTNGLAVYATLLHNLGQDAFIKSRGASGAAYFNKWATNTHQDFTYFASQIGAYTGDIIVPAATDYPTFVPVSSVYQTGRSYMYDSEKRYIQTMQPYVIPYGEQFTVDLNPYKVNDAGQYESGSVVIGNGFKYSIKSVDASNANGTFVKSSDGVYTFTPNSELLSGKIYVTLEITTEDGKKEHNGKPLPDVDLVLEFQQSHNAKKLTLERTTYTYTSTNMYTDAETAYENNFAGSSSVVEKVDHKNPTQNCNTDIWFYPDTPENRKKYPNAPESYFVHDNTIEVIDGKLYVQDEGRYRIYLRGRLNCALYYSTDGGLTYTCGATIKDTAAIKNSHLFRPNDENTYFDLELEADSWIYIKEVLIVQSSPAVSYIGVGMTQWTVPMYTSTIDDDGTTHFWNSNGQEVTADEANNTDPIPPTNAAYVNAYRSNFEFVDGGFTTDYFYKRTYNYNYAGNPTDNSTWDLDYEEEKVNCNKTPWDNSTKIENLFTAGQDTFFHSGRNDSSSAGPMILELDMGKEISANSVTFYGRTPNAATTAQQGLPKNFTVEVSMDGKTYTDAGTYTNPTGAAYSATVDLNGTYDFRYVRLTINSTHSNSGHFILSGIKFTETFRLTGNGANHISPDKATYSNGFKAVSTNSVFGHAYFGNSGDTVNLTFEGTRFAVLNTAAYGKNYEVWIDGVKVESVDVKEISGGFGIGYISEELASGTHNVEIRCTGEACFDSFAIYG